MPVGGNFTSCNCGPDVPECQSPTQPVATVGLCLADGTPIAVTVVRDCAGAITSQGWINLVSGQFSAGAVPAGAIACGDSRSIQVSGTFCDLDPGTGDVLGLVLIEYSYAADGSIAGVRLVDATTGDTYAPAGEISVCPAGVEQPEGDLAILCDRTDDGAVTTFVRDWRRDENGQITGFTDYDLDGGPYTPAGQVGACELADEESPAESCRHCQSVILCDTIGAADIAPGAREGVLPNGIGWAVSCSQTSLDGWPWALFPCPTAAAQTWTFDRPVRAVWSTTLGFLPAGANPGQVVMPEGTVAVSIHPTHVWDEATRTLSAGNGAVMWDGVSTFRHAGPVSELEFANAGASAGSPARHATTAMTLAPARPAAFLRTICRDCDGSTLAAVDTTLDGAPYTPLGVVGVCEPEQTEQVECVAAVEVLRLCDLNPDAAPTPDGKVCATPFLRTLVFDCRGALTATRDTTLAGEPYSPVAVVDCTSQIPALTELEWPLTAIEEDPDGPAGRAFVYTLTNPETGETATVRLTASSTAGASGCPWTGPAAPDNPPVFNNRSTYAYVLDEAARRMDRFTLDFLDLDTFEGIRGLTPVPDAVEWVTGQGVWNGSRIDATVNNSVVRVHWNTPPETIGHTYENTGGGNACHSAALAGFTMRPDGCCACDDGGDESPGEPCRDTSTLLLCDETSEVSWEQVSVEPDPASPPGQGFIYTLSPVDDPDTIGTIRVTVDQPDNISPCVAQQWRGGTTFTYELDETARQMATLRVNLYDFDRSETVTMVEGVPSRLGGNAYTTGGGVIRSNANNAYGYLFFDAPPESLAYRFDGSCIGLSFDAVSSRTVQFTRRIITDCQTGETAAVIDTTLDGQPYTPTGDVGQCAATAGDECLRCETLTLCDVNRSGEGPDPQVEFAAIPLATLADGPTGGTLPNGVNFTVSCGSWLSPQGHYTIYPGECDQTWTFDQPVYVRFGVRGFNVGPRECMQWTTPSEVAVESLHPNHRLGESPNSVCGIGAATDESVLVTTAPVTELTLTAITNSGAGRGVGLMEVGLPADPPPAAAESVTPFLRTMCRDCGGNLISTRDATPDGQPYAPTGTVTACTSASAAGGDEPCRDAATTLLCDVTTTDAITVFDPANVAGADGWQVVSFTGANPGYGPASPPPYDAFQGVNNNGETSLGARADLNSGPGGGWPGWDLAPVRWVLAKTFIAPQDGNASISAIGFRADGGGRARINGQDLGLYSQWGQPGVGGNAQVPVTEGPNVIEIEVRDDWGFNWVTGRLDIVMERTVQFLRKTVTDCQTGETVSITDTTLDGEPYEVTGQIGQCEPTGSGDCCPPEWRVDVETGVLCLVDQASGDVVGRVLSEWVYDDQTGERIAQRLLDLATGAPVTVPDGAEVTTCPTPDRITRQVCVVKSGSSEFATNPADATSGQDSDWMWAPTIEGAWYPMYRVAPNPAWTVTDTAPNPAHWVSPHQSRSVCSPNPGAAPNVTATWYTRASWNLPADADPDSIRIAATIMNGDNGAVEWRLNDGPWQPIAQGALGGAPWAFPPTAVPGGRPGQNEIIIQQYEQQPGVACPSLNEGGMIMHVYATYDHAPQVWTQVIEPGGQMYYLDENGGRQDAIPDGSRLVPCGGGDAAAPVEPCGDTEVIELCDVAEDGSTVRFLRHITHGCDGTVTGVTDTGLDGTTAYVPAGTVIPCAEPCRDTSSTLLCDTAATDLITVFDPAAVAGADGWEVVSFTGANPGRGPEAALPYPARHGSPFGYPALGARTDQAAGSSVPWSGYDTAPVRWVLRKTFTAPQDGVAVAQSVGFRGDGGARVRINGVDAGMYGQWNRPATTGTAQIPVTAGPNTVEIEVRDVGGINNVIGRLDIAMPRTVQFMRRQTVDCETGDVISTVDTTLDGDPYEVVGEVGQCEPVAECCEAAPPELRVDVETELTCMIDEASGDVVARVRIERVYDDQSGDLVETRITDPVTGDPVQVPAGAVIGSCEAPCPQAFSTECVGVASRSEASYDNTSLIGGQPGQCGSVQGPTDGGAGANFGCGGGPYTITSWIVNGVEVIAEGGGRTFNGGPCGPGTTANPGMHRNWAEALTNLDPTGATWVVDSQPACAWYIRSQGGSGTVYGPMTITGDGAVVTGGTWVLGPTQACDETQFTRVYRQDCDGGISVVWLDQAGNEVEAPEGEFVRCGTGCSPAGGDGLDVEVVTLCDVQPDGTSVPFLRHVLYDTGGAVALVTDTDLGGLAPYSPSGQVGVCEPDPARHLVEECRCDDTDGDGAADTDFVEVIAVEADGSLTSVGTYTADMSGPYAPVAPVACPAAGSPGPELDAQAVVLCDIDGAGQATPFIRHLRYNAAGEVIAVADTALDGATAYAPAGTVDHCGDGGGGFEVELTPLCVIDTITGGVIQEILAEVIYDTGSGGQAGVRYVDRATFAPVALPGGTRIASCPRPEPECPAQVIEACRCDDTTGDGAGDTDYTELLAVSCAGEVTSLGTYTADLSAPYAPVAPVPCADAGAAPVTGVQAGRVELAPGASWSAATVAGLQSVTATAHEGTGAVTTAEGVSTLHSGESVSWSVSRDADAALTGPLTIAADTGTVTVAFTRTVTL